MSEPPPSFTGRRRERRTRGSVVATDRLAKLLISAGGIGTILAVSGVFVFLVWVVVPLFLPASIEDPETFEVDSGDRVLHLALDDYGVSSRVLRASGTLELYRTTTGEKLAERRLFEPGLLRSASFLIQGDLAAFGLADGHVVLADVGFDVRVVDGDELPQAVVAALAGKEADAGVGYGEGVVQLTPAGQYRVQTLRAEPGRAVRLAEAPVALVSHALGPEGPLVAALVDDGGQPRLFLIRGQEDEDFLTGETTLEFDDPIELPFHPLAGGLPSHLAITGAGDNVYVAWKDGTLARVDCSRPEDAYVAEEGSLLAAGRTLESVRTVLGNNTLVWGDSEGTVRAGFLVYREELEGPGLRGVRRDPRATKVFAVAKRLADAGSPALSLGPSARSRLVLAGFADGEVKLLNVTSTTELAAFRLPGGGPATAVALSPKEESLAVATPGRLLFAGLDPRHPEASFRAFFRPVWYEGYSEPRHTWQSSSGTDDFEVKLGLVPLVFGTLKATFYSMLFGAPLALLAAVFTSEFLSGRAKSVVKPGIELMASLPSVVLGFLAALVFAPYVERVVPTTLVSFVTLPLAFLLGAYLWQLLPGDLAVRGERWRPLGMVLALPLGVAGAYVLGPLVEGWLFGGDLKAWLAWEEGAAGGERYASAVGGWMLLCLPLSAAAVALFMGRAVRPRLRAASARWDRRRYALADLAKFGLAVLATVALALAVSALLDFFGFDPRGSFVDTYVQRNALIVGFVMGFAIIPIIYTISEDALSSVPEHLRSASLGAGATTWQTAVRIVVPTAMSGLFSALMIGLGRAVGETMIVLMAAGNTPVMEWNVFEGFRTLSANIAVELPEAVRNSTHYRTLFLAALVLFLMTFLVNTVAEIVRQRFRKRAYQL